MASILDQIKKDILSDLNFYRIDAQKGKDIHKKNGNIRGFQYENGRNDALLLAMWVIKNYQK